MKQRIKDYFTKKPKSNFWRAAFILVVLFQFVTPNALVFITPLQVGLIAPEATIDYNQMSENITSKFIEPLKNLHESGIKIGRENPLVAKVLFYALSSFVWAMWVAMAGFILELLRQLGGIIYGCYLKQKKNERGN